MKRLMTSAAMALALATGAYAASPSNLISEHAYQASSDFYASDLIGERIYVRDMEAGSGDDNWKDIGEINDLIVTESGEIGAVIVGVGGFLGIGEKDVAVDMAALEPQLDDSGERFLTLPASREQLESAPAFARGDMKPIESSATAPEKATEADTLAATAPSADKAPMNETAERAPLTAPRVERENYAAAKAEELTAAKLDGATVYGPNDEAVGEIEDLMVDPSGKIDNAVIDVGGFLGMGEKPVMVGMKELTILSNADGDVRVYIDSTKETLEAQPEYRG